MVHGYYFNYITPIISQCYLTYRTYFHSILNKQVFSFPCESISIYLLVGLCFLFMIGYCFAYSCWQRSCLARRTVIPEPTSFFDTEPDFLSERSASEDFGARYYRHVRHPSPEGLAEVCIDIGFLYVIRSITMFCLWC